MSASRTMLSHTPPSSAGVKLAQHALRGPGQALDTGTRGAVEARFDHDFSRVRVHHGPAVRATASAFGANAFTLGRNIGLPGPSALQTPRGQALLRHELVHVVQQTALRGRPATTATLEAEAERAAAGDSAQAIVVQHAAPPSLACSREEWLESSPDLRQRGFSELVDDIDEIQQWMGRQTTSSPEFDRLTEALAELQAEVGRRTQKAAAKPKRKKKRQKDRQKGRQKGDQAQAQADTVGQRAPRILTERSSVAYTDAQEVREEVDRIMAWLQRDDVNADDRVMLDTELQHLSPQFEGARQQQAAQRHNTAVAQALAPNAGLTDERAKILDSLQRIDGIVALAERPGFHALMQGSELIAIDDAELARLRGSVRAALDTAAQKTRGMNSATSSDLTEHMRLNYESQPYVGFVVSLVSGEEPVDLYDRVQPMVQDSNLAVSRFRRSAGMGEPLALQAGAVLTALELAQRARGSLDQGVDRAMSAAGTVVSGLTVTRDLSFAIALSIGAVVAAPVVAAGVGAGGLGLTGAGAVAATSLGTGAVVATGGFGLHGGAALSGELLAGNGLDQALTAGWKEGKRGAKQGASIGVGGGATFQTARNLGLGVKALSRGQAVVRSTAAGTVGGSSAGLTQGLVEGKSASETLNLTLRGAGMGGAGGLIGGASSTITQPVLRGTVAVGGDAALNAAVTYAETGDTTQALQSAAMSVGTSGALMAAQRPTHRSTASQKQAADMGNWMRRRSQSTLMAMMLGTAPVNPSLGASVSRSSLQSPRSAQLARPAPAPAPAPAAQATAPAPTGAVRPVRQQSQQAVPGRVAGPEVWNELHAELGPGSSAQSLLPGVRGAAQDAQAAGLIGSQGAPGTVAAAFQPHRNASAVRGVYGVTGRQQQSMHVNATSLLRSAAGYSRSGALTLLGDPATHAAFDAPWKQWAMAQRRAGRTTCSVGEMRGVMHDAISQTPNMTPQQRGALAWQLEQEIQALGLTDASVLPLPYSNIRPAPPSP